MPAGDTALLVELADLDEVLSLYARLDEDLPDGVVDLVRGQDTQSVIATLKFAPQGAAEPVLKLVESAIANLRVKADEAGEPFDERNLVISSAFVDEGPTMKRFRPRAQGRAGRINKRTSHITVLVTSKPEKAAKGGTR